MTRMESRVDFNNVSTDAICFWHWSKGCRQVDVHVGPCIIVRDVRVKVAALCEIVLDLDAACSGYQLGLGGHLA